MSSRRPESLIAVRTLLYLASAISLALAAGCAKPTSAVVERRDIIGYESLPSQLVTPPPARADIYSTYRAPVERVLVTVGARVRRGEVLAELSFPNMEAAFEQARASVRASQDALARMNSEYSTSIKMYQEKIRTLKAAEARGEMFDPVEMETAQRGLQDAIATRDAAVAPYKESLRQSQEALVQARSGQKLASIRTPISGTVIELYMQSGVEVGADSRKPVAVVVDLDALEVHAVLNDENFSRIEEHDDVVLAFKELPNQSFEGNVARIMTVPKDGNVERHAVIRFTNKDGLVKPGMAATASVKLGEVKNVLSVPTDAVDRDSSGKPVVNVMRGNDWAPTVVEIGMSGGGYTEIKSGLNEGDTIQVTP